jgi:DNA-binding FrmR family transcriptional regulator
MQLDQAQIHWRLDAIIGHLEAVDRMVEEDKSDEQLICQVQAVRGALDRSKIQVQLVRPYQSASNGWHGVR